MLEGENTVTESSVSNNPGYQSEVSRGIASNIYRLAEKAFQFFIERVDLQERVREVLVARDTTNLQAFNLLADLYDWDADPSFNRERCLRDNQGYTIAEGVITVLRSKLFSPEEIEARYQYTPEAIKLIEEVLNDRSLRNKFLQRNFPAMVDRLKSLKPYDFSRLTVDSLKVCIALYKATGKIVDNITPINLSESDHPLIQRALLDIQYYLPSGGLNYSMIIDLLDPDQTRKITISALSAYISNHFKDSDRAVIYAEKRLNREDCAEIQRMFDDPDQSYYHPDGKRNYAKMLAQLDPDGARGITQSQLASYIVEMKSLNLLTENPPKTTDLRFEVDFPVVQQYLDGGGKLRDIELLRILDPNDVRGLTESRVAKFYNRWSKRRKT